MKTSTHQSRRELTPLSNAPHDPFGEKQIKLATENNPEADFHFSCSDEWCQVTTNDFELVSYPFPEAA